MKVVSGSCQLTMLNAMEITRLNEEDLRIRKQYGIKDDEDWFDGRWGIKTYKRSK